MLADEFLRHLAKALCATLPMRFTGKVTVTVNFHDGTAGSAVVGMEEGTKL